MKIIDAGDVLGKWTFFLGCSLGVAFLGSGCVSPNSDAPPAIADHTNDFPACGNVAEQVYGPGWAREGSYSAEGDPAHKPWSSYWYSVASRFVFEGTPAQPSPLEKYDQWVNRTHPAEGSKAASTEATQVYKADDVNHGLCAAWAVASLLEPEPKSDGMVNGVSFGVGDLKALLIKAYDRLPGGVVRSFSQHCDGLDQNLTADQFHRVLQAELLERHHAILLNSDPAIQDGDLPVFKAQLDLRKDRSDPHLLHAVVSLTGASYLPDPQLYPGSRDFSGTQEMHLNYTYDLYGVPQANGGIQVQRGEWTGESVDNHPLAATVIVNWALSAEKRRGTSRNPQFKTQYLNEILGKKPDPNSNPLFPFPFPGHGH